MKNFNIYFSSKEGKIEKLVYDLYDTEVVDKFLKVWKQSDNSYEEQRLNWFSKVESLDAGRKKLESLNDIIKKLNATGHVKIPKRLLLNQPNLSKKNPYYGDLTQHWKLNELHEIFELWSLDTSDDVDLDHRDIQGEEIEGFEHYGYFNDEMKSMFEHINWYVHDLEWYLRGTLRDPDFKDYFYVVRNSWRREIGGGEFETNAIKLTDDDFNQMERVRPWGYLNLDFATVGKDMSHAFRTKDPVLIERQNIAQQKYIRPAVNLKFQNKVFPAPPGEVKFIGEEDFTKGEYDIYYKWCKDNGATKYGYDYKSPPYNMGRIPLGETKDLTTENFDDFFDEFSEVHHVEVPKISVPKTFISLSDKGSH